MSARRFSHFIILAEMRTGSNFLEANINQFPDLKSWGELFNPVFVGGPRKGDVLGYDLAAREKDPLGLLAAIRAADPQAIPGFRFFHNHDPRVLEHCLSDESCAKVVLTRNPLESYVSRKIAEATGQWKLTNVKHRKQQKIRFDNNEFRLGLEKQQEFQIRIMRALQVSGQTAFYIHYDDLHDVEVLNGLARFLGSAHRIDALDTTLKKQNTGTLESKVENHEEMVSALSTPDYLNLGRTPNFEPRRGAAVPDYIAGEASGILFLPVRGALNARVASWLEMQEARLGGSVITEMNQKILRQWRKAHPGFTAISVVSHPLERAHAAYCRLIGPELERLRISLVERRLLRVPRKGAAAPGYDQSAHAKGFRSFLGFLKDAISGQAGVAIRPEWASQSASLQGICKVVIPSRIIREYELPSALADIEAQAGLKPVSCPPPSRDECPWPLAEIHDRQHEKLARQIYPADYLNFGFDGWGV